MCRFDWFYYLVKLELKDSGFYDETNYPNKEIIASCTRSAFYNIRGLELPHYSYVYKYSLPVNDSSFYYPMIKIMDKFVETSQIRFDNAIDPIDKKRWEIIRDYVRVTRNIYDKFDDISRNSVPMWQKRIYLANIKNILNEESYDYLDRFQSVPILYFQSIDK